MRVDQPLATSLFMCSVLIIGCAARNATPSAGGTADGLAQPSDAILTTDAQTAPGSEQGTTHRLSASLGGLCLATKQHGLACTSPAVAGVDLATAPSGVTQTAQVASDVCVLTDQGQVWCAGAMNTAGELGLGKPGDGATAHQAFQRVAPLPLVVDLQGGWNSICARDASGNVWCWGDTDLDLPGCTPIDVGPSADRDLACSPPTQVPGLAASTQVAVGQGHTCSRGTNGTLQCWGHGDLKRFGDNSPAQVHLPLEVTAFGVAVDGTYAGWASIAVCARYGTTLSCRGDAATGEPTVRTFALPAEGWRSIAVDAGGKTACVLAKDGSVHCQGDSSLGKLGCGPGLACAVVPGVSAVEIVAQQDAFCGLLADDTVRCWGKATFEAGVKNGAFLDWVPKP
jgi:alpha-tubulin suppressor-like RCC1 family protein